MSFEEFDALYRALTGHDSACRWQYRLCCDIATGSFPSDVELATGIGKTSIIAVWLIALGQTIQNQKCPVPRRLAFIVDRRVVVDQASEFAESVRTRLEAAVSDGNLLLNPLACALRDAGCTPGVLETSTLRGQRTLDTRWRDDPSRPAIVVGTVDMIGSRLLFSAYGRVGPWGRALEAGLLGQDCLIVLDEAHLCSPFAATLSAIEQRQSHLAPFAVIRMGATIAPVTDLLARTPGLARERQMRAGDPERREPFRLHQDEVSERKVSDRLFAPKRITLIEPQDNAGQPLAEWAVQVATQESGAAVGIILNTVSEARRCTGILKAGLTERGIPLSEVDLVIITGSMRGWDRDAVTDSTEYARFRSNRDRSVTTRPAFLIATSCIEVGADIDCDHLGTEVCPADSFVQRLGRVNRLGLRKGTGSTVIVTGNPDEGTPAGRVFMRLKALDKKERCSGPAAKLLRRLLYRANSAALFDIRVPPPALTPAVLDDLSMTSKYPKTEARVDVSRWLHGSVEDSSLYVEIAWRAELDWITDVQGLGRLLSSFPIAPRETARCPVFEAVEVLAAVRAHAVEDQTLGDHAVFFVRDGVPDGQSLRSLPIEDRDLRRLCYNAVIVLPTSACGYDGRFVDASAGDPVVDVAEEAQPSNRARRRRLRVLSGCISVAADESTGNRAFIDPEFTEEEMAAESGSAVRTLLGSGWRVVASAGDAQAGVLVVREDRRDLEEAEDDDAALGFHEPVLLDRHLHDAREKARLLCERLRVANEDVGSAVVEGAGGHDLGKDCPWWQRAVGRYNKPPIAKSREEDFNHGINQGYRHELGSVAKLQQAAPAASVKPGAADLSLHLVAAHHGHGRPGFRFQAAGPIPASALQQALNAVAARFARAQVAHGWWGLAWLEALVKAADVLASRDEEP